MTEREYPQNDTTKFNMILLDKNFYIIKTTKQKGRGVFAKKEIPNGTIVADYLGRLIKVEQENAYEKKFGNYIMFYNHRASIVPADIKAVGAHLFNHSCSANCAIMPLQKHMAFTALRKVFPNEELTVNYAIEPPSTKDKIHYPCFCESPLCHGTMHASKNRDEKWCRFVRKQQDKDFNKLEVKFGECLKPLKKYPKFLNDTFGYPVFASLIKPPIIMSDNKLPKIEILREKIKNTGQCLYFPKINYCLFGITESMLVSAPRTYSFVK